MSERTTLRLMRSAAAFGREQRGGVAITFAIAIVPVAFLSLVLLDYSRASTARQGLQENLDAATLIAARSTAITADAIDTIGDKALSAQLASNLDIDGLTADASTGRIAKATFTPNGTKISGAVDATYTPLVAGMFLGGPIKIAARSEVVRSVNKLEIALVLDTTGSMQGTKIKNLRDAAEDFIDTMEEAAKRSTETDPVKISLVPFSSTVRVVAPMDMTNYNTTTFTMTGLPTWLDSRARSTDWTKDLFTTISSATSSRIDRFKMLKQIKEPWGGCVEARKAPYDVQDTAPVSTNVDTLFTPFFAPDEADTNYKYMDFGSSNNNYLDDGPSKNTLLSALGALTGGLTNWLGLQGLVSKYNTGATVSGGGPNDGCVQEPVSRLSTDFTALKTSVKKFAASGETNIPMGLAWGWHTLSPSAPFADGKAYGTANTTKIIVLMTDGDNTMSYANNDNESNYHGYGYIWQNKLGTTSSSEATRTTKLNERMAALYTNIKAKDIVIYTVGVGVSANAKTLLKACASPVTGAYYDVDSEAGNLNAAFSAIAGSIENLRISK